MKAITLLRYATLAALLAGALPAPAAAQFGSLKRKLKEKIIMTAVEKAVGKDSSSASSNPATPGAAPNGATRARKGAPAPQGPTFDAYLLQITPDVLDRLERALAAEIAARNAAIEQPKKLLSSEDYDRCKGTISTTPEGQKAHAQYMATWQDGTPEEQQNAMNVLGQRLNEAVLKRCGPDPRAVGRPQGSKDLYARKQKAGEDAFGLGERQYALVKERVHPFCASQATAVQVGFVYTPTEIAAMTPRCGKLVKLLQSAI